MSRGRPTLRANTRGVTSSGSRSSAIGGPRLRSMPTCVKRRAPYHAIPVKRLDKEVAMQTIEQAVGTRVREARDRAGLSQSELGAMLSRFAGRPWSRQAVSAAELGLRAFSVADVWSLALTLNIPP